MHRITRMNQVASAGCTWDSCGDGLRFRALRPRPGIANPRNQTLHDDAAKPFRPSEHAAFASGRVASKRPSNLPGPGLAACTEVRFGAPLAPMARTPKVPERP